MGGMEKIFLPQSLFPRQVDDMFGVGQHSAKQGALGLKAVVGGKTLDGDGRGGAATSLSPRMSFCNHKEESSVMGDRPQ